MREVFTNKNQYDTWRTNTEKNIYEGMKNIYDPDLKNYHGRPWVIIGASPDLNIKDIDFSRNAVYCYTDRAFKCVPNMPLDFVVSIDPSNLKTDIFDGCNTAGKLICHTKTWPELIKKWEGEKYWYIATTPQTSDSEYFKTISDKYNLPILPGFQHVTGTAYLMALLYNATEIKFYGCSYEYYGTEIIDYDGVVSFLLTKYYADPIKTPPTFIKSSQNQYYEKESYDGRKISFFTYPFPAEPRIIGTVTRYTDDHLQYLKNELKFVKMYVDHIRSTKNK